MDPVMDDEAPAASDNEALADDYEEDHAQAAVGFFYSGEIYDLARIYDLITLAFLSVVCLSVCL